MQHFTRVWQVEGELYRKVTANDSYFANINFKISNFTTFDAVLNICLSRDEDVLVDVSWLNVFARNRPMANFSMAVTHPDFSVVTRDSTINLTKLFNKYQPTHLTITIDFDLETDDDLSYLCHESVVEPAIEFEACMLLDMEFGRCYKVPGTNIEWFTKAPLDLTVDLYVVSEKTIDFQLYLSVPSYHQTLQFYTIKATTLPIVSRLQNILLYTNCNFRYSRTYPAFFGVVKKV